MSVVDIKEESERIHYELCTNQKDHVTIYLPIRSIHNIPVEVSIVFKLFNVYLKIVYKDAPSQRLFLLELDSTITVDQVYSILSNLPNTLHSIKYDPYTCFHLGQTKDMLYAKLVQNIPHIECAFGECSVCYILTRHRTICKHYLCYYCDSQVTDEAYKSNRTFPRCPLCRADIS